MKCPILFSGKNKKNIINLSSAENAQREVKVKGTIHTYENMTIHGKKEDKISHKKFPKKVISKNSANI